MMMRDDSLLLPRENVEAQLRSCLAYRREHPDWRGRSLRLAYSLLHWWDERDAAVNDCLDRQRTIDDLRVVLAATRAALRALEQCCSWSDTMQQWTLAGRERTQPALQAAREALARLDRLEALGPMLDPSAWLDGLRFENLRDARELLGHLLSIAELLEKSAARKGGV